MSVDALAGALAARNQASIRSEISANIVKSNADQATQLAQTLQASADNLQSIAAPNADGTGATVNRTV